MAKTETPKPDIKPVAPKAEPAPLVESVEVFTNPAPLLDRPALPDKQTLVMGFENASEDEALTWLAMAEKIAINFFKGRGKTLEEKQALRKELVSKEIHEIEEELAKVQAVINSQNSQG